LDRKTQKKYEHPLTLQTPISGNVINDNSNDGIDIENSSQNIIDGNNQITNNHNDGVYLSNSTNNTISNNNLEYNNNGIDLESSSQNIINGNQISYNNNNGIDLEASDNDTISYNTCKRKHRLNPTTQVIHKTDNPL